MNKSRLEAFSDGVIAIINTTANGTSGLDLVIKGKSLSIRANASGARLNLAVLTVTETDTGGANPRSLTIGDSTVATATASTTTPVSPSSASQPAFTGTPTLQAQKPPSTHRSQLFPQTVTTLPASFTQRDGCRTDTQKNLHGVR